jgi:HEAT repeat protein
LFGINYHAQQELYTIADVLARLHHPMAVEPLVDVFRKSKGHPIGWTGIDITVFGRVIEALGELGDPKAVKP